MMQWKWAQGGGTETASADLRLNHELNPGMTEGSSGSGSRGGSRGSGSSICSRALKEGPAQCSEPCSGLTTLFSLCVLFFIPFITLNYDKLLMLILRHISMV